jgi:dTMP kinase
MSQAQRGVLIAVEGIDGCGKSSLITHLDAQLTQLHRTHVVTREPGGSDIGQEVRKLLQQSPIKPDARAEYLLFAADRAQHFATVVLPALEKDYIVLSDRMGDSSVAYQGYGRGLDISMIQTVNAWAMHNRTPDITFFIRIDPRTAFERIVKRKQELTRIEQEKISFFERVAQGYEELFKNRADVCIIDGTQTQDEVAHIATTYVQQWLTNNTLC